jgi:1,4-alpha-glucan branching enzyme
MDDRPTFSVWAPNARQVEVETLGKRLPLTAEAARRWSARVAGAGHGTDYAFRLDAGEPRPDPHNHLGPAGNHRFEFRPYFTDRYTTPWGDALDLDGPGSDEVRRFLIDKPS